MITPEEIISRLGLEPHPGEGGYFVETYRAAERLAAGALDRRYGGERSVGTAIYFLLTRETSSAMHLLQSDEVFHFYLGDPVEMLHLYPDGHGEVALLGPGISGDIRPQIVVPRGVW